VDSTEATQGGAIAEREPSSPPPLDAHDTSSGAAAMAPAPGTEPTAPHSGELAPEARPADGTPHRRRRRRHRRPPMPAAAGDAATAGETAAAADAAVAPTGSGDAEAGVEATAASPAEGAPEARPILRLRNRRRRHRRPHAPGLLPGTSETAATADGTADAGSDTARSDIADGTAAPANRSFRVPRRRRRHAPLGSAAAAPDNEAAAEAAGTDGAAMPPATPGDRPPRRRRRRPRANPADAAAGAGEQRPREPGRPTGPRTRRGPGTRPPGERGPEQRDAGRPGADRGRDRPDGRRDHAPGRPPGRPPGRGSGRAPGHGAPPAHRVERKLYSFDSVVDRGFEDVEEESGTRRVHWTIVKRTTADQVSRKPLSALYVVQRDGVDSEFPSLGTARNAVNKNIVHPEKLTRSKAEYAAEKKK
jgi:hypothetical protein